MGESVEDDKKASKKSKADEAYTVKVGINYPTSKGEVRAEPGDVVTDIPSRSVGWLLECGAIEPKGA